MNEQKFTTRTEQMTYNFKYQEQFVREEHVIEYNDCEIRTVLHADGHPSTIRVYFFGRKRAQYFDNLPAAIQAAANDDSSRELAFTKALWSTWG